MQQPAHCWMLHCCVKNLPLCRSCCPTFDISNAFKNSSKSKSTWSFGVFLDEKLLVLSGFVNFFFPRYKTNSIVLIHICNIKADIKTWPRNSRNPLPHFLMFIKVSIFYIPIFSNLFMLPSCLCSKNSSDISHQLVRVN